jgi:hypothetical protein
MPIIRHVHLGMPVYRNLIGVHRSRMWRNCVKLCNINKQNRCVFIKCVKSDAEGTECFCSNWFRQELYICYSNEEVKFFVFSVYLSIAFVLKMAFVSPLYLLQWNNKINSNSFYTYMYFNVF